MQTGTADQANRYTLDGRYQVGELLGLGGMAEVRDGWDTRLNRPVAIKLMHRTLSVQSEFCDRFRAEARAAAGLSHANIVSVHDCGEENGTPFIVMERLPGPTLADEIARGPLPEQRVRSVLDNVLAALGTAHASGVLHRDVKPGNILAAAWGDGVKVADFGIAKTPAAAHTATGQIVGTLAYLSPERIAGAPASAADDLYAVGVVGYEALAGHRPFRAEDNIAAMAHAILNDQPPPLKLERPDVDPKLIAVIERAMARDPSRRFNSADEMRAALNGGKPNNWSRPPSVAATHPATRALPGPPVPSPLGTFAAPGTYIAPMGRRRRRPTNRSTTAVGVAAALALLVVAAAFLMLSTSSSSEPAPVSTSTSVPLPATPLSPPPQPPVVQQPVTQVDQSSTDGNSGKPGNKGGNGKKNFKPGRGH
ncbi:MAG: serine/threonine-protein kinase [Candidatus Sericytochromatia bacterium]